MVETKTNTSLELLLTWHLSRPGWKRFVNVVFTPAALVAGVGAYYLWRNETASETAAQWIYGLCGLVVIGLFLLLWAGKRHSTELVRRDTDIALLTQPAAMRVPMIQILGTAVEIASVPAKGEVHMPVLRLRNGTSVPLTVRPQPALVAQQISAAVHDWLATNGYSAGST